MRLARVLPPLLCLAVVLTGAWLGSFRQPCSAAEPVAITAELSLTDTKGIEELAEELLDQRQYAPAAEKYAELAFRLPASSKAQQAWLKSGTCWFNADRPLDALRAYDQVLAVGAALIAPDYSNPDGTERKLPQLNKGRISSIRDRMQRALRDKVLMYRRMGDADGEARAMLYLIAEFPTSEYIARLLPPDLASRQQVAEQLGRRAHDLFWRNKHDEALPLLDQVISQYPDTAASMRARADKAAILWGRSRWDESRALYAEIWERVGKGAPDSALGRLAQHRMAWLDMGRGAHACLEKLAKGPNPTPEEWEQVRNHCRVVMGKNPDPIERAEANHVLILTYYWEQRYEDVLQQVKIYFRNYTKKSQKDPRSKRQEVYVRIFAGDALHRLQRYAEAIVYFRSVIDMAEVPPAMTPDAQELVPHAYWAIWWALYHAGAPQDQLDQAAQDVISRYPGSIYVRWIRQHQ